MLSENPHQNPNSQNYMTFTFDGDQYRIAFQHDKPRDLLYHVDHHVELCEITDEDGNSRGGLWCVKCELKLAPLNKAESVRNTSCMILVQHEGEWVVLQEGRSKLNVKAGDRYNREDGRVAALRNALRVGVVKRFQASMLESIPGKKEDRIDCSTRGVRRLR